MSLTLDYNRDATTKTASVYLRKYSKLMVAVTAVLIFAGSLVTSTGTGLSVPDWPSTYGQFMFAFPLSQMVGGIFYEHGHRLIASTVGMMTIGLVLWAKLKEDRKWLKRTCLAALGLVIAQGVLGGITVLFFLPTGISVMHAVLAQSFFSLVIFIAYAFSRERRVRELSGLGLTVSRPLLIATLVLFGAVFVQLVLGALMRHTESGLAVYDFPRMAGSWLPTLSEETLKNINGWRFNVGLALVTKAQVGIHLIHRFWALVVFGSVAALVYQTARHSRDNTVLVVNVFLIAFLTVVQIAFGAFTVLTQKQHLVASFHVITGAVLLGLCVLLALRLAPLTLKKAKA